MRTLCAFDTMKQGIFASCQCGLLGACRNGICTKPLVFRHFRAVACKNRLFYRPKPTVAFCNTPRYYPGLEAKAGPREPTQKRSDFLSRGPRRASAAAPGFGIARARPAAREPRAALAIPCPANARPAPAGAVRGFRLACRKAGGRLAACGGNREAGCP